MDTGAFMICSTLYNFHCHAHTSRGRRYAEILKFCYSLHNYPLKINKINISNISAPFANMFYLHFNISRGKKNLFWLCLDSCEKKRRWTFLALGLGLQQLLQWLLNLAISLSQAPEAAEGLTIWSWSYLSGTQIKDMVAFWILACFCTKLIQHFLYFYLSIIPYREYLADTQEAAAVVKCIISVLHCLFFFSGLLTFYCKLSFHVHWNPN